MRRGPLSNNYLAAVALVVLSLVPYLSLVAAVIPLSDQIARSLHLSTAVLYIAVSLSAGGYSVGTVLAVQMAVHLPARRMLVVYETLFVVASVLAAAAPDGGCSSWRSSSRDCAPASCSLPPCPPWSRPGRRRRCRPPLGS